MMKIKYIVVHLLNDFSGSPRVLADFCAVEAIQSQSLSIVTNNSNGFLTEDLGGFSLIWYPRGRSRLLNFISFVLAQVQIFFAVGVLCLRGYRMGERVVVINNTIFCLASMLAGRLMGAINIAYVHELPNGKLMKIIAERVIGFAANEILMVSNILIERYRLDSSRTTLFPNGLRSDFDAGPAIDLSAKFKLGKVLFVGSLKSYKGLDQLFRIAAALPCTQFEAILNCQKAELEYFKTRKRVPENLLLLSRVDDLQSRYLDSFIVLNLSLSPWCVEAFALTVLEGFAAGCPCIVPPEGGHMDYFDKKAGIALDSRQTEEVVRFIKELQANEERWRSCSRTALSISSQYSASVYREQANEFFKHLVLRYMHTSP